MTVSTAEALSRTLLLTRDFVRSAHVRDDEIVKALHATSICVLADADAAAGAFGARFISTVSRLAAMLGMQVRLVLPTWTELAMPAAQFAADTVPGARLVVVGAPAEGDLVLLVGSSQAPRSKHALAWRVGGTDWSGKLSPVDMPLVDGQCSLPVGPAIAAVLACMEAYKAALRRLEPSEYVKGTQAVEIELGSGRTWPPQLRLGRIDVVSGGAITHAFLHVLLAVEGLDADVRVFEPQIFEGSNLNRYVLALRSMIGWHKTAILERASTAAIRISGDRRRVDGELIDGEKLSRIIAVGVDHIPTRWLMERANADWVGVGSTSHFYTRVSDHVRGEPCPGCLHPENDPSDAPIPTVSFVSYWAGLVMAAKLLQWASGRRHAEHGEVIESSGVRFENDLAVNRYPLRSSARCPSRCAAARALAG